MKYKKICQTCQADFSEVPNPKLAEILIPKPIKVTVYITLDQWSNTMPLSMASICPEYVKKF